MSEYQFYEWQAIDRPLTAAEQNAVSALSSHIDVTSTRAWIEYNWSGFKHDPLDVLARYFDAFLCYANWGMQQLAFRLPGELLDEAALHPYLWDDCCRLIRRGDSFILSISKPDDEYGEPPDQAADLSTLATLRRGIMGGDNRMPYLAWLVAASGDGSDDDLEPPVPPGLKRLTPPLEEFARFFDLDPFIVRAAAETSEPIRPNPAIDLDAVIAGLSRQECEGFVRRLADDEPLLSVKLHRRLAELAATRASPQESKPRRTWLELQERAETLGQAEEVRRQAEVEAKRIKELQQFAARAEQTWRDVDALIQRKQAPYYDQATVLLVKLHDLAVYNDKMPEFASRLRQLCAQYANRPAFQERLREAGLS